ncbi:hypothetical protein D3C71_947110 [compost metagenome]
MTGRATNLQPVAQSRVERVFQVLRIGAVCRKDPAALIALGRDGAVFRLANLQPADEGRQRAALAVEQRNGAGVVLVLRARLHHLPQAVVDPRDGMMARRHGPLALQIDHAHAVRAQRCDGAPVLKLADLLKRGRGQFLARHEVVQTPRRIGAGGLDVAHHTRRHDLRIEHINGQAVQLAVAVDHLVHAVGVHQRIALVKRANVLLRRQVHHAALGVQQAYAVGGGRGVAQLFRLEAVDGYWRIAVAVRAHFQHRQVLPRRVGHQAAIRQQQAGARRTALAMRLAQQPQGRARQVHGQGLQLHVLHGLDGVRLQQYLAVGVDDIE